MNSPALKVIRTLDRKSSNSVPTVIYIHGNSANSGVWQHQLKSELLQDYPMLAVDLPGHGKSPRSSLYTLSHTVEVLVESCYEFDNFVLIGHSLGGHLAIEALPRLPNCTGLLIFGTPPIKKPVNLQEAFLPEERMALLFKGNIDEEERERFAQVVCHNTSDSYASLLQSIDNTDPAFREGLGASVANGELSNEAEILRDAEIPIAILHGVDDALVNLEYIESLDIPDLWEGKVHPIENSSHSPHIENPLRFNELLFRFLKFLD